MQSNYKKLGDYVQPVNNRNTDLKVETLLGVSIQKILIPSIANTVGTNMKTYKIIKQNQFAYGPVTSRNGDKISIALLQEYDEAIISQAYTVFEVVDSNRLHPEYLMMWFRRPEFDRYARFKSHGSARETFDWEEMCEVELPIPSIKKQREIVKEYNTVINRIILNEQLNQKLEETAQALYKYWFEDFEFPNEEGKPYKSSGGAMVYNDELDKEIPEGWAVVFLSDKIEFKNGKSKPNQVGNIPIYGGNGILGYANKFNFENIIAIGRVGAYCGSLYYVPNKCWISDNAICGKSKNDNNLFSFYLLKSFNLNEKSEGTGQPLLTQGLLNSLILEYPNKNVIRKFEDVIQIVFDNIYQLLNETESLSTFQKLLLSKMTSVEEVKTEIV
ncbi:restriction endonuclease subunit S [Flagellimonas zhangzhouensis]|uniref:Type I restriction enzyme, S subunit n=1 Tax=Flagellimonas zhangzhouensis TaxID=1073328 RepID=A0A1H2WQQ8_9FLAO|nr:restriction endonuclease subunit S [Allomuricauda zhangzhouensis]SDQ23722.1 type I restriction enzyme, S subunit [Allomuricauda zhangzhouensis]SDW82895.1 type I restriction enzyme, S subunit [Allomuricauda zhangzhouensis]